MEGFSVLKHNFVVETDRLILRQMTPEDFDSLFAVLADSDISRHYPYSFDKSRVMNWINVNIERYNTYGFGLFAVVLKETGEFIGDCGLTMQLINGVIRPEIGYHILKRLWRNGFGKEAAAACRNWAFGNTPFNRLYSYMKAENIASQVCAAAIGMDKVDEFIDAEGELSVAYAIDREKWRSLRLAGSEVWSEMLYSAKRVQSDRRLSPYVEAGCVAASVLASSGRVYTGICVDTCSTLGICAERNAIFNMLTNSDDRIVKVLALKPDGSCGAPCGACRELMVQLSPDEYRQVEILLDYETKRSTTLGQLTPEWWIG